MINGFEDETCPLNEAEMVIARRISKGLGRRVGSDNAITATEIMKAMDGTRPKLSGARVRKIVNYIRMSGMVPRLMATSKGYYVSNDREELLSYVESLRQREDAIAAVRNAIVKQIP